MGKLKKGVVSMIPVFGKFVFFCLLLLPFLAADAISGSLTQRAVLRMVGIFWRHKAIGINNAKTLEQLGLTGDKGIVLNSREIRALIMLVQGGIIRTAENERMYIPEKNFDNFARFLGR